MTTAREQNRANFPQAAQWLDELRAVFGPGCKLECASEGGREIGKPVEDGVVPGPEWKPCA